MINMKISNQPNNVNHVSDEAKKSVHQEKDGVFRVVETNEENPEICLS